MQLTAAHQASGDVSRLQRCSFRRRMGRQVAGDRNQDIPTLVGVPPDSELPDPGFQHLIRMEGAVTRTEFGREQFAVPGSGSGRGGGSPRPESFVSEDPEREAGREMALDVEGVVDSGVNRQKALS